MFALTWQTILLLALAYFAGCFVGCFARKLKGAGPVVRRDELAMAPAGAGLPREAAPAPFVAPIPAPAAVRPIPVQNAFRRADRDARGDADEPAPPLRAPEREARPVSARTAPPPAAIQPPESAAVAVAAALATPPPAPAVAVRDDLTRIRAIDGAIEAELNQAGVTRYSQIAAWTSDEVKAISKHLGFSGRIERENWIEQAYILARGDDTHYATKRSIAAFAPPLAAASFDALPDVASRAAFAEPRRPAPVPEPAPVLPAVAAADRDNLQRIGGITAEIEQLLFSHGVTRYARIAGWEATDVEPIERLLGGNGRVSRENWIEQAQILATGGATAYSRAFDLHGGPPVAAHVPGVAPDLSGLASVRSQAFRSADSVAARPNVRDDLKRIRGVGVALEARLNALGVSSYDQIAGWTAEDVATVSKRLGFDRTIERENWIEQAQILARGGVTAFARTLERRPTASLTPSPAEVTPEPPPVAPLTPARPPVPDLSGMRSVRSEAYRSEDSLAAPTGTAEPDDLKRIRGVGLLIERKLYAMGVTTYDQIANWTAGDIGVVNEKLDFKGRIERENWIEQARILASGGHTDFSRRLERGEV